MKSAITVSLTPQARGGPFVYWDDLPAAFTAASRLGFDAVEIFPPAPEAVRPETVQPLIQASGLPVAAIGTGGAWVVHRWHFAHPDSSVRASAIEFVTGIIRAAAALGAPAIIGSVQGKAEGDVSREQAISWLATGLEQVAHEAERCDQTLLYEPLNRYETNLFNRVADTRGFLKSLKAKNIRILADLFHMNIEETSIAQAVRDGGDLIGHFHFADSNRRAVGFGHTEMAPIAEALREIGYQGYISAEVLPLPTSEAAAEQTIISYRKHFAASPSA